SEAVRGLLSLTAKKPFPGERVKERPDMTADVALTGIVAWLTFQLAVTTAATGALALTPFGQAIYVTPPTWILMLAPLGQVFFITFRINNLSASTARTLFLAASPTDAKRTITVCTSGAHVGQSRPDTPSLPIGADEVTASTILPRMRKVRLAGPLLVFRLQSV